MSVDECLGGKWGQLTASNGTASIQETRYVCLCSGRNQGGRVAVSLPSPNCQLQLPLVPLTGEIVLFTVVLISNYM